MRVYLQFFMYSDAPAARPRRGRRIKRRRARERKKNISMRCGHCFIFRFFCVCFIIRLEANILPRCDHNSLLLMLSCRGSHQRSIPSIPSALFLSLNSTVHSRRFSEVRPGHCRIQQFRNRHSVVRERATQRARDARARLLDPEPFHFIFF